MLKIHIILIISLTFLVINITAQNSFSVDQAPNAAVTQTGLSGSDKVDEFNSKTKTFESTDGGFKVYFPVKPEKDVKKIENPWGLADFYTYSASSSAAFLGVTYFDSPAPIIEEAVKKINYERQKDFLADSLKASVVSGGELIERDFRGMEYVLTDDKNTYRMRVFFVNQRLFRLIMITRGITGKIPASAEKKNQDLAEKFFDSFSITSIPDPALQTARMPEDFGIGVENGIFSSEYFGLKFKTPPNFTSLGEEQFALLKKLGLEDSNESSVKNKDLLRFSIKNTKILFVSIKETGFETNDAVFLVAVESNSFPIFIPKNLAEYLAAETLEEQEVVTIPVQTELIGGTEFAWYETLDKTDKTKQRLYLANVKGLALEISLIFETEEDLKIMLESLRSIRFEQ